MSDLCMYELEDIVWEDIGNNEDHIVPRTGGENKGYAGESDGSKRVCYELRCAESTADKQSVSNNAIQREEPSLISVKEDKETMLENSPWSRSSNGTFSALLDGDPKRSTSCTTSEEDRTSDECMRNINMGSIGSDLCADEPVLGDGSTNGDNNLFHYQINNASHTENGLGFLDNNLEDKDSSDLLYYGWPEIENFEDIDRMFRSCDSTFGLGTDNNDELGWFSSSHEIEGSDDALKSSFSFPGCDASAINNVGEHVELYGEDTSGVLNNVADQKLTPISLKRSSQKLSPNGSPAVMNSFADGCGAVAHIDSDSQIHSRVSQLMLQKPSEGKRKERSLKNGGSRLDKQTQRKELKHSLDSECSFSKETREQQETTGHTCFQTTTPLTNSNNQHPSDEIFESPGESMIKSEDSSLPSASLKDSSNGSNHMRSVESSQDISLQNPGFSGSKGMLQKCRPSVHLDKSKLMVQKADSDQVSSLKPVSNYESEVEGQSEVNGNDIGILGELDSSTPRESSCMSSVLDEISIEASSFRQLQHVMEQLDIRTKLCIRDSLYRLARSAEQRHKCVGQINSGRNDKDASGGLLTDETNKGAGLMDMETDTNPIDRSIAHLLFHRPSDPSATSALDAGPAKSHAMVQTPTNGSLLTEQLVSQEQTTANNDAADQQR